MTSLPSSAPSLLRAANAVRVHVLIYWVTTLVVAAESAVGGLWWDLGRTPYVRETLAHLGYPLYFATVMGVAKGLAVAALLVPRLPRLKEWAYAGVFFVYAGAAASHFAVGDPTGKVLTPIVLAVVTLASWALRPPTRRDPAPLPGAWPSTRSLASR
jgi:DoxX-like family